MAAAFICCYIHSCLQPGDKCLTWAEAVAADCPFGVVWAHVALLALLLWERWIWQRGAFVLWPEGMEDQTWDAAAGASFLGRLPLLFNTDILQILSWTTAQIHFTFVAGGKKVFAFSPPCLFPDNWLDMQKSECRKTNLVFLEWSHCASRRVFFHPDQWRGGEKVKSNVLFIRAMPTWQRFNVAFRLLVHKGPVFELWCLLNPTHPADMQTHTHKHTGTHWHSWQTAMPLWLCQIESMIKGKQHYPPKTHKRVCAISDKWTKIKWKKLELN